MSVDNLTPQQRYRKKKRELGLCNNCAEPAVSGYTQCLKHKEEYRAYQQIKKEQIAEYKRSIRDIENARKRSPAYREKRNANRRKRAKEDPQYVTTDRLRKRVGRAIRDYAPGMKLRQTKDYIGCTMDEFMAHIESQFVEGMSWENRHLFHIDHIRPCSSFDLTNPEEQRKCFHYTNLQPLWAVDNLIKGDKY